MDGCLDDDVDVGIEVVGDAVVDKVVGIEVEVGEEVVVDVDVEILEDSTATPCSPSTGAMVMASCVPQHSVLSPQHQVVEFRVLSQGVMVADIFDA